MAYVSKQWLTFRICNDHSSKATREENDFPWSICCWFSKFEYCRRSFLSKMTIATLLCSSRRVHSISHIFHTAPEMLLGRSWDLKCSWVQNWHTEPYSRAYRVNRKWPNTDLSPILQNFTTMNEWRPVMSAKIYTASRRVTKKTSVLRLPSVFKLKILNF